jgi:hypothetical protein
MVEHVYKNATSLVDQMKEIIHSNIYTTNLSGGCFDESLMPK